MAVQLFGQAGKGARVEQGEQGEVQSRPGQHPGRTEGDRQNMAAQPLGQGRWGLRIGKGLTKGIRERSSFEEGGCERSGMKVRQLGSDRLQAELCSCTRNLPASLLL